MPVAQVWGYRWPSGSDERIAILKPDLAALAASNALVLESWEEEGLGPATGCGCRLPSGRVVALARFEHLAASAFPGPNLSVDSEEHRKLGTDRLLAEVRDAFRLGEGDFAWTEPRA